MPPEYQVKKRAGPGYGLREGIFEAAEIEELSPKASGQ
jgi:hypothetical protein